MPIPVRYISFVLAQTYKYIGEYQLALDGFSMASQLDPSWAEAKTKETELLHYLNDVQKMIETKVSPFLNCKVTL